MTVQTSSSCGLDASDLSARKRLRAALELEDAHAMSLALLRALQEGADPNEPFTNDNYSGTPLGMAINLRRVRGVEILLAHGADPNVRCSHNYWPLQRAAMLGDPALCEVLIRGGADLAAHGRSGKTPLMDIGSARLRPPSDADCQKTAQVLLKAGCDPLVQGVDGEQALHEAMRSCRIGVIRELLMHLVAVGGPLEIQRAPSSELSHLPQKGAADIACSTVNTADREAMRCMLLACGMSADALEREGLPSLKGWTPLEAAAVCDWVDRVDQLLALDAAQCKDSVSHVQAAAQRAIEHGKHNMGAYLQSHCAKWAISRVRSDKSPPLAPSAGDFLATVHGLSDRHPPVCLKPFAPAALAHHYDVMCVKSAWEAGCPVHPS